MGPHAAMTGGGGHAHSPMASRANLPASAGFIRFEGALLYFLRRRFGSSDMSGPACGGSDKKFIVQTDLFKVSFLFGYPLLQARVRQNTKFSHGLPPMTAA